MSVLDSEVKNASQVTEVAINCGIRPLSLRLFVRFQLGPHLSLNAPEIIRGDLCEHPVPQEERPSTSRPTFILDPPID